MGVLKVKALYMKAAQTRVSGLHLVRHLGRHMGAGVIL